jgi:hypothetical protein
MLVVQRTPHLDWVTHGPISITLYLTHSLALVVVERTPPLDGEPRPFRFRGIWYVIGLVTSPNLTSVVPPAVCASLRVHQVE